MKKVKGTMTAWLTAHAMEFGSDPESIESMQFSNFDMRSNGWVKVGDAEVTIHLLDKSEVSKAQIDTLKEAKRKLQADTEAKLTVLEEKIQSLLALPSEV